MSLSQEHRAEATRLRAQEPPMAWVTIAMRLRVGTFKLKCALIPGYTEYARDLVRARRQGLPRPKPINTDRKPTEGSGQRVVEEFKIPRDVLLDRDRRLAMAPRSLTAALCGDPAPGRSALDKRQGA